MKTIFMIVVITIIYVVGMTKFSDSQDYLNASLMAELEQQYNMSIQYGDIGFDIEDDEDSEKVKVSFTGEVNKKTKVSINVGSTIEMALQLVGGLLESADERAINLSYIIEEECSFYIPKMSDVDKISINNATVDELDELPSIGKVSASKIIAYREENGPFEYLEQIKKVTGIGSSTFEKIKDLIIL